MDLVAVLVCLPSSVTLDLGGVVPERARRADPWEDLRLARRAGELWPLLLPKGEEHGIPLAPAAPTGAGGRLRRPASASRVALLHAGLVRAWAPIVYVARGVLGSVLVLGVDLVSVRVPLSFTDAAGKLRGAPRWFLGVRAPWWTSAEEQPGDHVFDTPAPKAAPTPTAAPTRPQPRAPQADLFAPWVLEGRPA